MVEILRVEIFVCTQSFWSVAIYDHPIITEITTCTLQYQIYSYNDLGKLKMILYHKISNISVICLSQVLSVSLEQHNKSIRFWSQ